MSASDDTLLIAKQFMQIAYAMCPKDTGLLSTTIRSENTHYLGMSAVNVYVGSKEAYYMPYTNEEWVHPRWKGKKNPNEHWWDKAIAQVVSLTLDQEKGVMING